MKRSSLIDRVFQQEDINFLLTNKVPRRLLTQFIGWLSRIEHPLVRDASIGAWKLFAGDLNLQESRKATFTSLHDCFIRELKEGTRPINRDPDVLVSPCDGIVGACGLIRGTELLQAKGSSYALEDLLGGRRSVERYRDGHYVTLRLTSNMYHRFHAPYACEIEEVIYISGDVWNVNPIALNRIARLYCKNERAVLHTRLDGSGEALTLVAVAAILVASIHKYRGPNHIPCRASFDKGEELGYFHHGSTIIVVGTGGLEACQKVRQGEVIRMGEPLLRRR
jgi:phosphatidylserine decarboxylase